MSKPARAGARLPASVGRVIYQHPLAYLLGIEGLALLRAWAGDYDEAFVTARLAEVRRLLDDPGEADAMGQRARERVLDEHTYRHRARQLLELVGLTVPA